MSLIPKKGTVYVVDDDEAVRDSLQWLLEGKGYRVRCFDSAESFLSRYDAREVACLIVDIRMGGMTGLELQNKLLSIGRRTPIVFISGESEKTEIIEAFRHGAIDFVLKPFSRDKLCLILEKAMDIDRRRHQEFVSTDTVRRVFNVLSNREKEIFMLIVQGLTNKGIAEVTGIQPGTAKKHRATIYQKLAVNNAAELMGQCKGLDLPKIMASIPVQRADH